ncbi:hypothetical protein L873DRAFT_1814600 [Choiromyces venosus 120613-1]|uniref:Mid2 domain-containing protein n=1 Tax=Choiromyces venosus 120613-1 TaxID=1336337 RepID=A0A3N4JK67_9PEZI|nr:hypothetical protein L873DRAFT_1814600 [Choiromyces venosus 120613-1]
MKTCTPRYSSTAFIISLILILITINVQTTSAYSYSTGPTIFRRQSTCESDTPSTPCDVKGFCCPSDTRCIPIENKTSVVCCKKGEYCDQIFPITCQSAPSTTRSASATATPQAIQCGSLCCPLGYECGPDQDRCLMKQENIPEDYKKHREEQDRKDRESNLAACQQLLNQKTNDTGESSADGGVRVCHEFSTKAVLVGLFPGIALGVAIMFGYTKIVEMKTRRRTINFNNPSPDDISWAEQKSNMQQHESIAIGYSPHLGSPESRNISPANWKPITPADFSPNLGPTIPPRERSTSRDRVESRMANSRNTPIQQTPSPHPLAARPLEPRAQSSPRSSTDSETNHSESYLSSTISNTNVSSSMRDIPPPDREFNQRRYFSSEVSSVITDAEPAFSDMGLDNRATPGTERGRGRIRLSTETGYSDSVYQGGSSVQQPFVFEDEDPPLHVSRAQSPLSAVREQSPYASPFNHNGPVLKSPFADGTPPSRFGGF